MNKLIKPMIKGYLDYSLFLKFFEYFSKTGLEGIDLNAPLIQELENTMEANTQLFSITDVILLENQFVSKGVSSMFGIERDKFKTGFFITTTDPADLKRHHLAREKLIASAHELYNQKKGRRIISTNFKAKNQDGTFRNLLYQANLFYSTLPHESVFLILVITDISKFENIHKGFHFYSGDDSTYFRYPDNELLAVGICYSHTEFQIIELIEEGLCSKEIAEKLFRSVHTINTHRTNIIKKSGKSSINEVIRELKVKGLL